VDPSVPLAPPATTYTSVGALNSDIPITPIPARQSRSDDDHPNELPVAAGETKESQLDVPPQASPEVTPSEIILEHLSTPEATVHDINTTESDSRIVTTNNANQVNDNSSRQSSASTTSTTPTNTHSPTPSIPLPVQLPPTATAGESIYRTIMNRLTALEANHTLYARYVEEQTAGVREMLKRLGEDVGRVEAIVSMPSRREADH